MLAGRRRPWRAVACLWFVLLVVAAPAAAHEEREGPGYRMVVGWAEEPAYTNSANAVSVRLVDPAGRPILDAVDTLKVEVSFGDRRLAASPLQPNAVVPGEYRLPLVPTRPGTYTFRMLGSIRGEPLDVSISSSETTFDDVRPAGDLQFPAKDPSPADLANRIDRLAPRVERTSAAAEARARAAEQAAGRATIVAAAGVGVGLLALVLVIVRVRGRRGDAPG